MKTIIKIHHKILVYITIQGRRNTIELYSSKDKKELIALYTIYNRSYKDISNFAYEKACELRGL